MKLKTKRTLWKGAAAVGTVVMVLTVMLSHLTPQDSVSAAEGVVVSDEISKASGNGPQKITSLKDFGLTSKDLVMTAGSVGGSIDGNIVKLADRRDTVANNSTVQNMISPGMKNYSLNEIGHSIPINMKHNWTLDLDINIAKNYPNNITYQTISGFVIVLTGDSGTEAYELHDGGTRPVIQTNGPFKRTNEHDRWYINANEDTGVYKNLKFSYNPATKQYTWQYGNVSHSFSACHANNTKVNIQFIGYMGYNGSTLQDSTETVNHEQSLFRFNSFEYTDFYMKASNHLTDYAGRTITGAVGSGHTVTAHPTVYNDAAASQRYSGKVALNPDADDPLKNVTLLGDMANSPHSMDFTHTSAAQQNLEFKAKITGDYSTDSGKEFSLPLQVTDDFYSTNQDLIDLANDPDSGVPGTWHNIKNTEGKEQLPLPLNFKRPTSRALVGDLNKTGDLSGCDFTRNQQPNSHGWYDRDVVFTHTSSDFDEINISSANVKAAADNEIKPTNIIATALPSVPCQISGVGSTGETGQDGLVYSIFGRNGNNSVTKDLSAITTETFRIDKTAPTMTQTADQRKLRKIVVEDNPSSGSDPSVEGSGIAYVEWKVVPSDKKASDIPWPSDDPDWLSEANGGWPSETDEERQIIPVAVSTTTTRSDASRTVDLPSFSTEGTYIFRTVDLAGNKSRTLEVGNHLPVLSAKNATASFEDTIADFVPKDIMKAALTDEDETIDISKLQWKIEKADDAEYPLDFTPVSGKGNETLKAPLLPGTYKVTFSMIGKDSDGNIPNQNAEKAEDVNKYPVTLTVTAGDPPKAFDKTDNNPMDPDTPMVTKGDGTKHTVVTGSHLLIVDPLNYYSGGKIIGDELAEEVEKYYDFKSVLPAPQNSITKKVTLLKNGVDFTANGIDTKTEGEYVINYQAFDASGNSVTMQFTYQVRTDLNVTFHAGKGDFKEPAGTLTKTVRVKYDRAPKASDIPTREDILAPVEKVFIGWGTTLNSQSVVDPDSRNVTEDITYYAVYVDDMNRDGIPDKEEAIFFFKSGNADHAAFKYTDRTVVGIPVPALTGAEGYLTAGNIPEILFDSGYRLKGWKTDITGEQLLTTEQLCSIGRGRGTQTTVTAITEEAPVEYNNKVVVTFFSSAPKVSPLKGGEGQTVVINAPKPGEPVSIPKEKLPEVSLAENTKLEGWKTSDTGDLILETDDITAQKLYGGKELTCIAYVELPKEEVTVPDPKPDTKPNPAPDTKPDNKPDTKPTPTPDNKPDNSNKTDIASKTETVVKNKVQKEIIYKNNTAKAENSETEKNNITFIFYTSRSESGTITGGDGTTVILPVGKSGSTSIPKSLIPNLKIADGSSFYGWKTSLTGSRTLSTKELCALKVSPGVTVRCTALFKYKKISSGADSSETSNTIENNSFTINESAQVPLGGSPEAAGKAGTAGKLIRRDNPFCITHWIMLIWLILMVATYLWRIHRRKQEAEYLYSSEDQSLAQFRTAEDYENLRRSLHTDIRDYFFLICGLLVGVLLFFTGNCFYELPLLGAGIALAAYYLIRMKMLDSKEKSAARSAAESLKVK